MNMIPASAVGDIRKHWGWYLTAGVCLIVLGIIALIFEFSATLAGVFVLGVIIAVAGVVQIVAAFRSHGAGHVFLHLLVGVLDLIVGLILLTHPLAGALIVTLFLAAMLIVGGLFRIFSTFGAHYPHAGWAILSGIIACILGILLWAQWPVSAIWFIGFCVGINFIFLGISWIALATRLHSGGSAATVAPAGTG